MRLKVWLAGFCLQVCSLSFATNVLFHPEASEAEREPAKWGWDCEIKIINNSFDDIRVYGVYDNGFQMMPFYIYSFEPPYHISLFYYGYCHYGMNLYIESYSGWPIYSGYTPVGRTIIATDYLLHRPKVEVKK